jgi:DNA helicase-2/ATP-dependent DNA helicase PcrA
MTLPEPRPAQADIIAYTGGRMGIAAVPGSGKTWTLSRLAARLIREAPLARGQQVLVVTLVNAARGKFEQQVRSFLDAEDLGTRYRVRTLHGLANDIVSERPGLVGLSDAFTIIDEGETMGIVDDAVAAWFVANPAFGTEFFAEEELDNAQARRRWREDAVQMAAAFIKQAKDERQSPERLRARLDAAQPGLDLARMCVNVYDAYERSLRYRGAVDFQDLIRLALEALEADFTYLERLRTRWPYILEDEAQDSSQLQEQILRSLAGPNGNWVRVGDPNQAIYETFTTANPRFLRDFLEERGVVKRELRESGRSAQGIIDLANLLIDWSLKESPEPIRERQPLGLPHIHPLPRGNPPDAPDSVTFVNQRFTGDEERAFIADALQAWLAAEPQETLAVLVSTNAAGTKLADVLRQRRIDYVEQLRTTTATRSVVGSIWRVLSALATPQDARALGDAYRVWQRDFRDDPLVLTAAGHIRKLTHTETFAAPRDRDWVIESFSPLENPDLIDQFQQFRSIIQRWQKAVVLPIDQLILTVSGDIFREPAELATAFSLAMAMRQFSNAHPEFRLREMLAELKMIAENKRKFSGLSDDDEQFDPSQYRGRPVIMTLHGAKGLEWDTVYLMSVNNYDFPANDPFDTFIGESWYLRAGLNLQEEALQQLHTLIHGGEYIVGEASQASRVEYSAERLRLLYVGITRARQKLVITTNTGRRGEAVEAKPMPSLRTRWEAMRR